VNVRKPLKGPAIRNGAEPTVTFSIIPTERPRITHRLPSAVSSVVVTPTHRLSDTEIEDDRKLRMDRDLSLAEYIISYPIPENWELRRAISGYGVYFFNLATSKPTSMIWFDPLYEKLPEARLEPLPQGWKRLEKNGELWYSRDYQELSDIKAIPDSDQPKTFQFVLQPLRYHFPEQFYLDEEFHANQLMKQLQLWEQNKQAIKK
jgi:hypothetical protein